MATERRETTRAEYFGELRRRFGMDSMNWAFVCPSCGHVATIRDYKEAGAPQGAVGFSCVGRWMEGRKIQKAFPQKMDGGPCDYAGGGFICINPVRVVDADGGPLAMFEIAPGPRRAGGMGRRSTKGTKRHEVEGMEMACKHITLPGGVSVFSCRRGTPGEGPRCVGCGRAAPLRCQFPTGPGKTCGAAVCDRCAKLAAPMVVYCPEHWGEYQRLREKGAKNGSI